MGLYYESSVSEDAQIILKHCQISQGIPWETKSAHPPTTLPS